jgi:hypothetical protein
MLRNLEKESKSKKERIFHHRGHREHEEEGVFKAQKNQMQSNKTRNQA